MNHIQYLDLLIENKNIAAQIDALATKIFKDNYKNILKTEDEFCIGIYEKDGKVFASKPVIGNDVEVDLPEVDGMLLALVHNHIDGLELSPWDEKIGEEYAKKNKKPFRIYVIGFNDENKLVMTYEEF